MQGLIFDVGMHVGRDTEFYLRKGFRVVAVEANPDLAERAGTQFSAEIASGQLTVVNKAVVDSDAAQVEFYVNEKKDDWGTTHPDWNRSLNKQYRSIQVPAVRFDQLIKEFGVPYYLKIDIEGADASCLTGCLRQAARPKYISVELMTPNNLAGHSADAMEILCCLRALGYNRFQISDQSRLKSVRCQNPPLEGNFVDFQFDGHSSGTFGRELQLKSYTIDEISELYLNWFYRRKTGSWFSFGSAKQSQTPFHDKGWFDVHATTA